LQTRLQLDLVLGLVFLLAKESSEQTWSPCYNSLTVTSLP
jgi:hypothetical protein